MDRLTVETAMEIWKRIPGYEYDASTEGQIRACVTGHILKPMMDRSNAYCVYYYVEPGYGAHVGKKKAVHVHRLVLEAFVGPRPVGRQCRHLDGNSLNNRLENLAWGTQRENSDDKLKHRSDYYLTPADVAKIRAAPDKTCRALAKEIGCCKSTVANVRSGMWFSG